MIDREERHIEVLDGETCMQLLPSASVGRLVVNGDRYPLVFPVNFAVDSGAIVFRTGPGTKRNAGTNSIVTFQVDDFDPDQQTGWSVMAHGVLEEVIDVGDLDEKVAPWSSDDKPFLMRLVPQVVSGRRVTSAVIRLI